MLFIEVPIQVYIQIQIPSWGNHAVERVNGKLRVTNYGPLGERHIWEFSHMKENEFLFLELVHEPKIEFSK